MQNCLHHARRMVIGLELVSITAALGAGVVAGIFFAFSNAVLPALARGPTAHGIRAMQTINVVILNRSFLATFVGTALACAVLLVQALVEWHAPGAQARAAGSLLYLLGAFVVTRARNIPENDRLAALAAEGEQAGRGWEGYVVRWRRWNDVRWVSSLAASLLFVLALRAEG